MEQTKRLEAQTAKKAKQNASLAKATKRRPKHFIDRIKVGSIVRLRNGGKERGEVLTVDTKTATVLFGAFRTKVELDKLTWVAH
jgi:hypothetical protein